jgi:hypothetical protein
MWWKGGVPGVSLQLNTFCTRIFPVSDHCEGGWGRFLLGPLICKYIKQYGHSLQFVNMALFWLPEAPKLNTAQWAEKLFDLKSLSVLNLRKLQGLSWAGRVYMKLILTWSQFSCTTERTSKETRNCLASSYVFISNLVLYLRCWRREESCPYTHKLLYLSSL